MIDSKNCTINPCSKCGGQPQVYRVAIGCQYFVECEACGKQGPLSNYAEEAIFLWNKAHKEVR